MKVTVDFNMFAAAFESEGRATQFSYEGKRALFEYFNRMEDDLGEEIELDVITLCCEYTEYSNLELFIYFSDLLGGDEKGEDEKIESIIEKLSDITEVIPVEEGAWIIGNF